MLPLPGWRVGCHRLGAGTFRKHVMAGSRLRFYDERQDALQTLVATAVLSVSFRPDPVPVMLQKPVNREDSM